MFTVPLAAIGRERKTYKLKILVEKQSNNSSLVKNNLNIFIVKPY